MWRPAVVTVPPATEPVAIEMAKAHATYEDDTSDAILAAKLAAARSHVERYTGTRLVTQTVTVRTDCWADLEHLPIAPVQSVEVSYIDPQGDAWMLDEAVYETRLEGLEPSIIAAYGQSFPAIRPGSLITVEAVVGYGGQDAQDPAIIAAILLIFGDLAKNRETSVEGASSTRLAMSTSVEDLLANHRIFLI